MSNDNTNSNTPDNTNSNAPEPKAVLPAGVEVIDATDDLDVYDPTEELLAPEDPAKAEEGKGEAEAEDASDADDADGDDKESDDKDGDKDSALPDYDPQNPETVEVYEKRYFRDDQTLNTEQISSEYWAAFEKTEGDLSDRIKSTNLSEGLYKFLEDRLGVPKERAKEIEAGLVLKQQADAATILSASGVNPKRYAEAIKWAKEGGYSEEQRQRFNAVVAKGGEDQKDAIEALMSRYYKATRGSRQDERNGRRGPQGRPMSQYLRRPSSPQRDVANPSNSNASGNDDSRGEASRFASVEEYREALTKASQDMRKAERSGDPAELRKASEAYKKVIAKGKASARR